MPRSGSAADDWLSDARSFARDHLGPASERLLESAVHQEAVHLRRQSGGEVADAVLAEVFAAAGQDRSLADEFLAFFLDGLMRLGHEALRPGLRRYLDTGDLVQSVLGDLWPDIAALHFESRAQFLALLAQRLRWKAADRERGLQAGRRREDRRLPVDEERTPASDPTPSSELDSREDRERLALALTRLPERDRELLRAHLRGDGLERLCGQFHLDREAVRKALQRAIARARELLR
ncbi:MAG: sigma-70 family RNA polymerase sigma factor [Planctomycetota bacterium]|nr:MAG: sigma-70 family RNA polymerase sigma factor [Planctomycetota bacterium]